VPGAAGARHPLLTDTLAIVAFATIGQLSHQGRVSLTGYAEDALPFLAGWFLAYRVFRGRFVPTWLAGVTLGVLLRAALLSHWRASELAFWLVSLAFIGAFAGVMRAASRIARDRRTAR
jgi:Protein of unknown function (DUF3054)